MPFGWIVLTTAPASVFGQLQIVNNLPTGRAMKTKKRARLIPRMNPARYLRRLRLSVTNTLSRKRQERIESTVSSYFPSFSRGRPVWAALAPQHGQPVSFGSPVSMQTTLPSSVPT